MRRLFPCSVPTNTIRLLHRAGREVRVSPVGAKEAGQVGRRQQANKTGGRKALKAHATTAGTPGCGSRRGSALPSPKHRLLCVVETFNGAQAQAEAPRGRCDRWRRDPTLSDILGPSQEHGYVTCEIIGLCKACLDDARRGRRRRAAPRDVRSYGGGTHRSRPSGGCEPSRALGSCLLRSER